MEIYLDSAATTKTPKMVIDAMVDYYQNYRATVHRGVYKNAKKATDMYELSRHKIAHFIGAKDSREIIFTRNATESINFIVQTWGRANIGKGDIIVLTIMEHHSNIVPWQQLCKEVGCKIEYVGLNQDYRLNLDDLYKKSANAKCISLALVSNVLGTINPVQGIIHQIKIKNPQVKVMIDGAQAVGHLPVSVQDLDCDFYVFSGHKMYGPTGIGVLWARSELLNEMPPYQTGGEMVDKVSISQSTWKESPLRFEAGTPNIGGAIGLGAAVDYINSIGIDRIANQEFEVAQYALEMLSKVPKIRIYGPKNANNRVGIFSFQIQGQDPVKLAEYLDRKNVSIRSGNLCAQPLLKCLGVESLDRLSIGVYNKKQDIDRFMEAINEKTI